MITPAQSRAARGLLGWTQNDLARHTNLSKTCIVNFENSKSGARSKTENDILEAFEKYNVKFDHPNGVNLIQPVFVRFLTEQDIQEAWPKFLKSIIDKASKDILIYNCPELRDEISAQLSMDRTIIEHNCMFHTKSAIIDEWILMPVLNTQYRIAFLQ